MILKLVELYPDFEALYKEVYELCRNTERMMGIFSKELEELDKNTVQYMIDEMQDIIDGQKEQLSEQKEQLSQKEEQIKKGICVFILDNLEEGVSRERILSKLQKIFGLSPEKAEAYFREATRSEKR